MNLKSVFTFLILSLLFSNNYASAWHNINIHNSTNHQITISKIDDGCVHEVKSLSLTIPEHQSRSFDIKDSNKVTFLPGSGCNDQDKWLRFKVTMYAGGQSTSIDVEWKRSGGQSNWGTKFSSNPGQYLALNTATCSGHNCLNRTYRDGSGNQFYNNLNVGIAPGGASEIKLNSLQLGTVVITDGYGDIIAKDPFRGEMILDNTKKYIISFSKSQLQCIINQGIIQCPSSIGFKKCYMDGGTTHCPKKTPPEIKSGGVILFFCEQKDKNDTSCPWTILSQENNLQHVGIHSW